MAHADGSNMLLDLLPLFGKEKSIQNTTMGVEKGIIYEKATNNDKIKTWFHVRVFDLCLIFNGRLSTPIGFAFHH